MRSLIRNVVLAAAALSSVACVTSSDVEKLQSQISDLQVQLAQMKRTASSKEEVQGVNQRIAAASDRVSYMVAGLPMTIKDLPPAGASRERPLEAP